jgi:hypothetical protein
VIVSWTSGVLEEDVLEEAIAAGEVLTKSLVSGRLDVALEGIEVVGGVKVVDPLIFWAPHHTTKSHRGAGGLQL